MNIFNSLLISFFAGISTLLGFFIIFFKSKHAYSIIAFSTSFSAGVMLGISFFDLIPSSLFYYKNILVFIFIICGVFLGFLSDKIFNNQNDNNSKLYKVGLVSMIAIIIHNIPEGILTFITSSHNISLGIRLAVAISMHNIPEGISIAVPIYYGTNNRKKAFVLTFISGFSEIFGSFIAYLFLKDFFSNSLLGILFAITSGVMIYISLFELIPTSLCYNKHKLSYFFILFGIMFSVISIII